MTLFLFYLFSGLALLSAYFVVTTPNLFRGAIGLIALLLAIAGMYLIVDAQFLSAVQIIVYVGGIVVLIVYVVLLMSDATQQSSLASSRWRKAVAGTLAAFLFVVLWTAFRTFQAVPAQLPEARSASSRHSMASR